MKFKHAEYPQTQRLYSRLSFARMGCLMGCILIAFLENSNTARYGMQLCDSNDSIERSHTVDVGPIKFSDDRSLFPTEAFFSSEQKDDPFLLLLSLRERCDAHTQAWMCPYIVKPQAWGRGRLYQELSHASLSRILYFGQLLC